MAKLSAPRRRKQRQIPILIVEDNADQWLIVRAALVQSFPEVEPIWMSTSTQAIEYIEANAQQADKFPRLILCDLFLPRREDGLALLDFIRTYQFPRKPPVIVLSSSRAIEDIEKSYSFGIASYIVKPDTFHQWLNCFYTFRRYWWEVVTLPFQPQQVDL